jgi:hypothetical protein
MMFFLSISDEGYGVMAPGGSGLRQLTLEKTIE